MWLCDAALPWRVWTAVAAGTASTAILSQRRRRLKCQGHPPPKPKCTVGVLADPQFYAGPDPPDVPQWGGSVRRYGLVQQHVRNAVCAFQGNADRPPVECIVQLGDIIDGFNLPKGLSEVALSCMLTELSACPCGIERVHHVVGNNEIRNFSRKELARWMALPREDLRGPAPQNGSDCEISHELYLHFYDFAPCDGWRFVILDTYAVSILGEGSQTEEAKKILQAGNPNCSKLHLGDPVTAFVEATAGFETKDGKRTFIDPSSLRRRFMAYNGAVGERQRTWLRSVLKAASTNGERVVVFGHNPIHPGAVNGLDGLAWDYELVLEILGSAGRGCVVAYLAGHDHQGGYSEDTETGIHHLTVPSPLEAPRGTGNRFLILEIFDDRLRLRGEGGVQVDPGNAYYCAACSGTGKALHDGALCFNCGGSGRGPNAINLKREEALRINALHLFFGTPLGITFRVGCSGT